MNIVHYIPAIWMKQGGVVRSILDWCSVFAERGHNVTLITYRGEDIPKEWFTNSPGLPHAITVPIPTLPGKPLSRKAMQLSDDSIRQADILHLHGPWLDGNRQMANLARHHKVPYIVSIHGMLNDWTMNQRTFKKKLYLTLFGRRFLNNAAMIHCSADLELAQARKWFQNPNTIVLPNLMDLKPFEQMPGPEAGLALIPEEHRHKPKVLFLSRLTEKKGADILIRAATILRDKGQHFIVLIAGNAEDDYETYLRNLTAELKLESHVLFLGLITGPTKISLYQSADMFVLPTLQENFGMVLTESLAAGTPVITTKGTDIWPDLEQAGATITESNPESIAAAIENFLARKNELPALGKRGRAWAFNTLAVEPLTRKYEAIYQQLTGSR
jgi:glycosyltransferase involved in cell wall biosynthesis